MIEDVGGRWKITVDVGRDPLTGKRRRQTEIMPKGSTKKQARDREAELRLAARGQKPAAKALTVGKMLDEWLAHIEADRSPTTMQGYRKNVAIYLRPAFGDLPARKLDVARIDALYRRIRKHGARGRALSPQTVRRVHATLSSACSQAVKWGWLPTNPCDRATIAPGARADIEPPDIEQIIAVLSQADDDLRDAIGLALATGARRGELCGLRWADIDLEQGEVTFRRAVGDVAGQAVVIDDEHRKSRIRTLALDTSTVAALKTRRARAAATALEFGAALAPTGYVLAEEPGQHEPLRPQLLSHRWRLAAKRAGVSPRLHDLRHWHITALLLEKHATPNVVKQAGWTSPQMLRVYGHAAAGVDREASEAIARRLSR